MSPYSQREGKSGRRTISHPSYWRSGGRRAGGDIDLTLTLLCVSGASMFGLVALAAILTIYMGRAVTDTSSQDGRSEFEVLPSSLAVIRNPSQWRWTHQCPQCAEERGEIVAKGWKNMEK